MFYPLAQQVLLQFIFVALIFSCWQRSYSVFFFFSCSFYGWCMKIHACCKGQHSHIPATMLRNHPSPFPWCLTQQALYCKMRVSIYSKNISRTRVMNRR
uniref:Putative secreted protein ovary overexpressed n=1 Tax=Rhipicephalus microplus TaxID=6941 RepID=A0A6M2D9Z2_RHIMP